MANESKSKIRLLKVLDYLREYTDENHTMSVNDIISLLDNNDSISADRKTIYGDIATINEYYAEVDTIRQSQNQYRILDRDFSTSEIQIIAAAVMAAGFISESQTQDLVKRLYQFTSKYEKEKLLETISLKNPYKHSNKSIFLNIETIVEAIRSKKKIQFNYYHFDFDIKKTYKDPRKMSPVDLIYQNDLYYLICYLYDSENERGLYLTYRIDKMENVEILAEEAEKNTYNSKKYIDENFSSKTFNMFAGEEKYVELLVRNDAIDPLVDRFGEKLTIVKQDEKWGKVVVLVKESRAFYSWVLSFGDKLKIVGDRNVIEGYKKFLKNNLKQYEDLDGEV